MSSAETAPGRREDRLAALLRMLEREPEDAFCRYGVAQEYAKRGDLAQAIAWFDRTIEVDQANAYAYFHKAKAQEESGDLAGAVATLREGLDAARRHGDAKAASELAGYLDEIA